jgi:hypothetical protein
MIDAKYEQELGPELVASLDKALSLTGTTRPMPQKNVRSLALAFATLCMLHERNARLKEEFMALKAEIGVMLHNTKPKGEA